ncbi:hypothetical protein SAMN05421780_10743 [Flexibacter flexilis DSM 6793]|uniref:DUF4350 domain-containing protein n=1 Tax=Flexibacter flexilis DSM 6793 TaxID=927664 RepID=A0A1I1KGB2_9BACT|nr:DUF4350 domain-containing protein [Flexibacter flexilis]SFC59691.1 hypothetical protein SAMN05421780_10743 [Flexibacter flexilis DSM 6793]
MITRANWKYWVGLGLLFGLVIWAEISRPKPIDWTATYGENDKIPYGSKIVYDLLPQLFDKQSIRANFYSVYQDFEQERHEGENRIFIQSELDLSEVECDYLLSHAAEGGHIFIATEILPQILVDSLGVMPQYISLLSMDSLSLNFEEADRHAAQNYLFKRDIVTYELAIKDSTRQQRILSRTDRNTPTLVQIPYGAGSFLICSTPKVFTNYNMLFRDNADYIAKALSYLPVAAVCWESHYHGNKINQGLLDVVRQNPALRWAVNLAMIASLLFIVFKGKRTQRIIPMIEPLRNTTVEFVETVANLYFNKREHQRMAHKRILYFEEYLRQRYHISAEDFAKTDFLPMLSHKTNVPLEEVNELFGLINQTNKTKNITDNQLVILSQKIDSFWAKAA